MAHTRTALIAGVTAATLLTSGAVLAAITTPPNAPSSPHAAVDNDFGKLSTDGSQAFRDVILTRLAIFDGNVDKAKQLINEADQALAKAKADDAVFTKAEADLRPVKNPSPQAANEAGTPPKAKSTTSAEQMNKPIAWLPVDSTVTINEDYRLSPTKTAAVADADKSLKSGDQKGAMDKLKLAGMDTDIVLAVLPLNQTISDVHQAAQLINSGKYFEGSQMLRQIQNNERYDVADVSGTPAATKSVSNSSPASPAVPAAPTK
jgi:hypothetical protein